MRRCSTPYGVLIYECGGKPVRPGWMAADGTFGGVPFQPTLNESPIDPPRLVDTDASLVPVHKP